MYNFACLRVLYTQEKQIKKKKKNELLKNRSNMADGVDIDLYSDDIDQNFGQMKVRIIYLIQLKHFILVLLRFLRKILFDFSKINLF